MVKYFRLQIKTAIQHEDNPRVYSFLLLSSSKKLAMWSISHTPCIIRMFYGEETGE